VGWFISRLYDRFLEGTERAGLRDWRRALLAEARGEVLELGAGTGGNLVHYPPAVTRLVVSEPDRHMRAMLHRKLRHRDDVQVLDVPGEALPFPASSFDTVVATLVLCSVQEPAPVLSEVRRVLRPGGAFLFLEHVSAPPRSWSRRAQGAIEPVWKHVAGNCHLTRDTGTLLRATGFEVARIADEPLPGSGPLMRSIRGIARPVSGSS
jgi:ubiquinone/menaquinone biosynthesis C-methylase UbiE